MAGELVQNQATEQPELYYSPSAQGFFWPGVSPTIPEDAQPLTRDAYNALILGQQEGKRITADKDGRPVLVAPAPESLTTEALLERIDQAADDARRALVGDPLRAQEYERTADDARRFAAADYPQSDVPRSVAAWAINGRNAQEAADEILRASAELHEALHLIRERRLQAKEGVRQAMEAGDPERGRQIAERIARSMMPA